MQLLIGREPGRIDAAPQIVPESGELLWDHRFLVQAPPGSQVVPAAAVAGVARRADIPAFVQNSLPAVFLKGQILCIPHLGIGSGATTELVIGPSA
jgi:hypothetical protein